MTLKHQRFASGLLAIAVFVALALAWWLPITASKAQPTLALPFATVTTGVTTSTQIVGANPSRRSIQICNPGTGNVFALPAGSGTPANNNGLPITTLTCFTPPTVTASGTSGAGGAAWNAFATASTNILVLEW